MYKKYQRNENNHKRAKQPQFLNHCMSDILLRTLCMRLHCTTRRAHSLTVSTPVDTTWLLPLPASFAEEPVLGDWAKYVWWKTVTEPEIHVSLNSSVHTPVCTISRTALSDNTLSPASERTLQALPRPQDQWPICLPLGSCTRKHNGNNTRNVIGNTGQRLRHK